jgi:hypothetical protein
MKEILETYKLAELKKMIRATNITGYSKLKKDELITLMTREENIDRFKSIKPKSARMAPVPEGADKPKATVLRELKKKFPAYKEYIEFYQTSGFTKPKDLPAPPKWLLEGKAPPEDFKIPKRFKIKRKKPSTEAEKPKRFKIKRKNPSAKK